MSGKETSHGKIYDDLNNIGYSVTHGDSIEKIKLLKDKSIKLMYGSPPYPNAKRNYKTWKINNYIEEISPFIKNIIPKLTDDGFIVINVKANRMTASSEFSSERSLVIEKLMIYMKENLNLYCVDIEIWIKSNPIPTGVRVACQDAYEYNLWFSKSAKWLINIDSIRRKYSDASLKTYQNSTFKPRKNGLQYVSREKKIDPNELGALPLNIFSDELSKLLYNSMSNNKRNELLNTYTNIVYGSVSGRTEDHQAVQPEYLPKKYILACTKENDIVLDPWVGSGTTGIVAVKNNRKFIGFDIQGSFAELAQKNISKTLKINTISKFKYDKDFIKNA